MENMSNEDAHRLSEVICCIFLYKLMNEKITLGQLATIENRVVKAIKQGQKNDSEKKQLTEDLTNTVGTSLGFVNALSDDGNISIQIESIVSFICGDEDDDSDESAEEETDDSGLSFEEFNMLTLFAITLFASIIPISDFQKLSKEIYIFQIPEDDHDFLHTETIRLISTIGYSLLADDPDDGKIFNFFSKN